MKLAINYSKQAEALLKRGEIEIDLFKCPALPHLIAMAQREHGCYVHFGFRAGRGQMGKVNWDELTRLMKGTATIYMNAHLAPCASDFAGMSLDARTPEDRARLIDAMERDVGLLLERFEREVVILESAMWDPELGWEIPVLALEPEFIRQVVMDTGCGFILDLAHASISARYFGIDARDYIEALPLHLLRELHVSGVRKDEAGLWKDHYPLTEKDWSLFEWAMERIRNGDWPKPWVVTFEHGGADGEYELRTDADLIVQQVPRLREYARAAELGHT